MEQRDPQALSSPGNETGSSCFGELGGKESILEVKQGSPPEMSEQEITYTELKFHTPTQQQMWQRAEKTKTKDFASPSSLWRYVAVILGILCVVLLGAVGFQSVKRLQNIQILIAVTVQLSELEKPTPMVVHNQNPIFWWLIAVILEILCLALLITARVFDANSSQMSCLETREHDNLTQQRENLENLTQQLELLQAQNLNLSEAVQQLTEEIMMGSKCCLCPDKWLQHGEDCYHFSNEFKIWQKNKDYCSSLTSKLLQTDSKEELDFIMQELFKLSDVCQGLRYHENYWFGLSYNTAIKKWVWEDGSTLSSHLFQIPENNYKFYRNGVCPYFQGEKVLAGDCWQLGYTIREKKGRFSA
ncbi:oxidized low-density lipoprotein receptor 1-like [Eretmochelys imbricata]